MIDQQACLDRALLAADWFVRTQLGQWRPQGKLVWDDQYFKAGRFEGGKPVDWQQDRGIAFNANRGRFLYYYHMPSRQYVPGLNWSMGRALFVLTDALKVTGKAEYRETAEFGAKYIEALFVTDPYYAEALGAIRELTPQGVICGLLDGAQAASGLLMLERLTGQANWLRLGRLFGDFILRHWSPKKGLPTVVRLWPEQAVEYRKNDSCIALCIVIPLWHLYKRTGEKKYLEPVLWAADRVLADYQRDDGAINTIPTAKIDPNNPPGINHHHGVGEGLDRFALRNDDVLMLLLLAAHEATGEKKYLEAANRYVRWIVGQPVRKQPYCVFPVQACHVLDVAAAGGEDHSDWVREHLDQVLELQVLDSDDPMALGGFRGEDEQGEGGVFGGKSIEYVVTRVTCYAAGLLYRLSGKAAGSGFSVRGV